MEEALELARAKDTKENGRCRETPPTSRSLQEEPLFFREVTSLVDVCLDLLKDNNFRKDWAMPNSPLETLLGDCYILMQVSSPTIIVERAGPYAWMHRSFRVREEFAPRIRYISNWSFCINRAPLQRAILPDPNPGVRDAAISCIEEMYSQAGPQFRDELQRHHLPTMMLKDINARLEKIEPKNRLTDGIPRNYLAGEVMLILRRNLSSQLKCTQKRSWQESLRRLPLPLCQRRLNDPDSAMQRIEALVIEVQLIFLVSLDF
ncbi:hypothetical protein HAX54_041041 [Datura stramonium]|uniref:Uncharacterized protein n=1 Tax=Datura stramonium TaxID=4076 RepID=A0ABS8VRV5_DATST|nr:hypothetical protein [Datura stramonium]